MPIEQPAFLQRIAEEARLFRAKAHTPSDLEGDWQAYMRQAEQCVPGLTVRAEQATVCLGELSPGCQTCKDGAWDCLFVTQKCNLSCSFCYSPRSLAQDFAGSAFGDQPEEIAANYARTSIRGISFSGGEPFLEPGRLLSWVSFFRGRFPEAYLWIYTNGTQMEERTLQELGALHVDEIRFNTAASGYDNPAVMEKMRMAAGYFPHLTIEIPAIPEHARKLSGCLERWAGLGVHYLNLHELLYEPGTNSWEMQGPRQPICLEDGHMTALHPESRAMILEVIEQVRREGLPIAVNHCSLPNKIHQIRGRRKSLLPVTKAPYEKLVEGELLESYYLYRGQEDALRVHPDELTAMRTLYPDYRCVRLERTAPLSIGDPGRWVTCEEEAGNA